MIKIGSKSIEAFGSNVILLPSKSGLRNGLFIPEGAMENTSMCQVISRGKDVNHFIKQGDIVMCKHGFTDRNVMKISETFVCDQKEIFAVIKAGMIYPLGRRVLVRREMSEVLSHVIHELESRRYQSLDASVIRLGLTRKAFRNVGIAPGDRIRLEKWTPNMIELDLPDNQGYGLIVDENDLVYKYEN